MTSRTTAGRFNTTVKASTDNAVSWNEGVLIEAAPSAGYSCLVKGTVAPGKGTVLFSLYQSTPPSNSCLVKGTVAPGKGTVLFPLYQPKVRCSFSRQRLLHSISAIWDSRCCVTPSVRWQSSWLGCCTRSVLFGIHDVVGG